MTDNTTFRHLAAVLRLRGMQLKDFYGTEEITQILDITIKSVRKLFNKGDLRPLMTSPGRYVGAFAEDLDRYLGKISAPVLKRPQTTKCQDTAPALRQKEREYWHEEDSLHDSEIMF